MLLSMLLQTKDLNTVVEYEAAFYGPKLDFMVKMLWKTMATRNNSSRLQLTRTF
jgi:threonyl-tRNA synthetase